MLTKHRTSFTLLFTALVFTSGIVAIFWARGFKPDFKSGKIERTGLIVATSTPTGAQVYLDDRLTSATDTNIAFLDPKIYKIRIEKEGYTTWEKQVEVRADLATEIKALLFPLAPEIKPLTTTGAFNPNLSPDGSKIVYGVAGERGGLYLLTMNDRPFPFRQESRQLVKNQSGFNFSQAAFIWSPDSKEVIAQFKDESAKISANLLIDSEKTDQQVRDITGSLSAMLNSWQQDLITRAQTQALSAPQSVKEATAEATMSTQLTANSKASPSPNPSVVNSLNYHPTGLVFSPDEEKILFINKEKHYKIYDLKAKAEFTLPEFDQFLTISWFPDSAHLIVVQKDLISIIEIDGANIMTVHSGKFENDPPAGGVFAHPSGTRLIILTTLTQTEGSPPNLYSINLR